jgi:hypothetical protein
MEKSLRAYQSVKFNYKNNNKYISVSRVISFLSAKKRFQFQFNSFQEKRKVKFYNENYYLYKCNYNQNNYFIIIYILYILREYIFSLSDH